MEKLQILFRFTPWRACLVILCLAVSCGKSNNDTAIEEPDDPAIINDDDSMVDDLDDPIVSNDDDAPVEESWSDFEDEINRCLNEGDWFARVAADPTCLDFSQPPCEALTHCFPKDPPLTMAMAFNVQPTSDILVYQQGCRCWEGEPKRDCSITNDHMGQLSMVIHCSPWATECDEAVYAEFRDELWRETKTREACIQRHFFVQHQCFAEKKCDSPAEVCNDLEGGFGYYDGYNYCIEAGWMNRTGSNGEWFTFAIQGPNLAEAIDAFIEENGLTKRRLFGKDAMGCPAI